MENNQVIARTGRVQNWIDDPSSRRLPVSRAQSLLSKTVNGRTQRNRSHHGDMSAMVYDLELALQSISLRLRGAGVDNGKGLIASRGLCSFGKIYSCLNEQLRRGGVYKNGAVVLHLDLNHP